MRYRDIIEAAEPRYFIRFGDIPAGERSVQGRQPNIWTPKRDFENGVSVFDAEWCPEKNRWLIVDVGNFATLEALLCSDRPIYLVTGKPVGEGSDCETLLRRVKIVKTLHHADLWILAFGGDGAGEEYTKLPDYLDDNADAQ